MSRASGLSVSHGAENPTEWIKGMPWTLTGAADEEAAVGMPQDQ